MSEWLTEVQLMALETITKTPLLGSYLGKQAAAEIRELRKQVDYHSGKWRDYEQDWILPLQKLLAWKAEDHVGESVVKEARRIVADNARLREACCDLLDGFWDMSPLEYALSRNLRDAAGMPCMSEEEGERIKAKARTVLKELGEEKQGG